MTVSRYNTRATGTAFRQLCRKAGQSGQSLREVAKGGGVSHVTAQEWARRDDPDDRTCGPAKGYGQIVLSEPAQGLIRHMRLNRLDIHQIVHGCQIDKLSLSERAGVSEWTVRRWLETHRMNRLPALCPKAFESEKVVGVFSHTEP